MPSYQLDADGDVEMTVSHPMFEVTRAPGIASWDQSALVKWRRDREQYERSMRERCAVTNEVYESVVKSVVNSVEPRILSDLARYTFEKKVNEVTDSDIMTAVNKKCNTMLNAHAPDIEEVFKKNLKMNLRELDIENRVMAYFVDFDRLVEEHGLSGVLGPEKLDNAEDNKHSIVKQRPMTYYFAG
ncbi:hypothetical protein PHMEG_00015297 [Phytophthora megakarya]|uniref:Uncharacterized protein n=1 Tax=Phytophthora megakarya TaxID=4795 RepID=A0A225W3A0_9STRA|nr:hypothetical protein PHMEG_00015297 [Phytophthora megakarya]